MECNKTCAWGCCDSEEKKNCKKCKFLPIFFLKEPRNEGIFTGCIWHHDIRHYQNHLTHELHLYHMSEIRTHLSGSQGR